jgi:hypothetical protein
MGNQVKEFDELGNAKPASELTTEWLTSREQEVSHHHRERLAPLPMGSVFAKDGPLPVGRTPF